MKIKKILNNNAAIVISDEGVEQIVMGVGLAYKMKNNDSIDASKIEKIFSLDNAGDHSMLKQLAIEIPMEYFTLSETIITYARTSLGKRLAESIHISLVDHIHTAILRFREGIVIKNPLLWDVKRFYMDEFKVGQVALEMIKEDFGCDLPVDEAAFIALHFVNAQMDDSREEAYSITKIMQEITTIVKHHFHTELDESSVYYYRFITHLKSFAQRLMSHTTYDSEQDNELLDLIKFKYQNSFACVMKIHDFIIKQYQYVLSGEEQLYLTIHIERLIYKQVRKEDSDSD